MDGLSPLESFQNPSGRSHFPFILKKINCLQFYHFSLVVQLIDLDTHLPSIHPLVLVPLFSDLLYLLDL